MHGAILLTALAAGAAGPAPREADEVLRWNQVALAAVRADRTPPPLAARNLAMVHGAVYDAVNTLYQTHKPYAVALTPTEPYSPEAAAATAAHRVLVALYPRQVKRFDDALDESLKKVRAGPAKRRGVLLGQYVAEKMLARRKADGAARRSAYKPGDEAGVWRPTPPGLKPALLPDWPAVTPFGARPTSDFRPKPPPALTSDEYAKDFNEVKSIGSRSSATRTAEQTLIAWFWDDGEGTATPPGHWNQIAQVVARAEGNTLPENARLFALLNVAMADAAIACWDCKYKFKLWRPVTAIRLAGADGNPDTDADARWESLLITPPFPSYTSGHSTFSGAAAAALAHCFGTDKVRFRVGSDGMPGMERSYASFSAAAAEAGRSRVYGGIHYECDNREGLAAGRALAGRVCADLLRPESGTTASRPATRAP